MIHRRLRYDTAEFDLAGAVARILCVDDLALVLQPTGLQLHSRETDQQLGLYESFYDAFADFALLYQAFVVMIAGDVMEEPFCFQTIPNLRIQYPENVAVGEVHRDRDYHHPDGEVNFWIPLTDAWDTNTIWLEYEPNHMAPLAGEPGEVIVFDAANVRHGNVINKTGCTRVSIDFRCLPMSKYRARTERTLNSGMRFRLGEFYRLP